MFQHVPVHRQRFAATRSGHRLTQAFGRVRSNPSLANAAISLVLSSKVAI